MSHDPLETIEKLDSKLYSLIGQLGTEALSEEGIPLKYKLLIAMALDAAAGAENGVKSLAVQALNAGATKEEIMQVVRITHYVTGVGSVYTISAALKDVIDVVL